MPVRDLRLEGDTGLLPGDFSRPGHQLPVFWDPLGPPCSGSAPPPPRKRPSAALAPLQKAAPQPARHPQSLNQAAWASCWAWRRGCGNKLPTRRTSRGPLGPGRGRGGASAGTLRSRRAIFLPAVTFSKAGVPFHYEWQVMERWALDWQPKPLPASHHSPAPAHRETECWLLRRAQ